MSVCTVNGREHLLEPGETVARLLERLGVPGKYSLVERNRESVERSRYAEVMLVPGDRIVVARPVAGG
ncbi:MAG: sulfur carrier protein ThiS [Acidobacteriota bacterium]|nr:sulfur carrier protein ThiS [Acidobacteriota bacterium]